MKHKIEIALVLVSVFLVGILLSIIIIPPKVDTSQAEFHIEYERVLEYMELKSSVEYDLFEINQEVIATAQRYFKDIDFFQVDISYFNSSWRRSYYSDYTGRTIVIGLDDIKNNPELYRLVLTHEYMHYVLHRYGLEDSTFHEGIADAYTIFLNRAEQAEVFGLKNEDRMFPYTIFTNQILEENNFNCLSYVFDDDNKMSSFEEILIRLEKWCDVSY